jgi:hypothetical protein
MKKDFILISFIFMVGFVCAANVSMQDAQLALEESSTIINELYGQGFSTTSASDVYSEALLVFQQATYADILRDKSIPDSDALKIQARKSLELINWRNLSFEEVIYYTDIIKKYRVDSYYLIDSINAVQKKIETYSARGANVSASENLLKLTNTSFYNGQITESLAYLEQAKVQAEADMESMSSLNVLAKNAQNFFVRYVYWIIFFLVVALIVGYFSWSSIKLNILKKKIAKLETEEKVLDGLMRKTQVERYKENKISGLIYNIRIKKYQERLSEIKQDLPVLKRRLHK